MHSQHQVLMEVIVVQMSQYVEVVSVNLLNDLEQVLRKFHVYRIHSKTHFIIYNNFRLTPTL